MQYSYRCGGYASRVNSCTAHSISADNVEALVLSSVKRFSRFVLQDENAFAAELQSLWIERLKTESKNQQSELQRCQKRYDELSNLVRGLYENLIMTSKSPVRSCDDVDEQALSYAEIKALWAGDPQIKEKMDLDVDVARLKVLKADHQSQQYRLEDKLMKYFPAEIEKTQGFIKGFQSDIRTVAAHPLPEEGFCGMTVNSTRFTEKADAAWQLSWFQDGVVT